MPFPPQPLRKLALTGLCLALALVLFLRSPTTNFVFDEQEALLANPFLQGDMPLYRAFALDFWGREAGETIGSYRPLPNLVWRALAFTLRANTPFYLQLVNIVLHGVLASLLGHLSWRLTGDRVAAWATALAFATLGLATEVVCGVVGLADVLGALCAVLLLQGTLVSGVAGFAWVLAAAGLGLLSKETVISVFPLAPLFAAVFARNGPPWRRMVVVSAAELVALVLYWLLRRAWFPFDASWDRSIDAVNNPLLGLPFLERLPTALELYGRGLFQLVVPVGLSGDYSFAQSLPVGWTPLAVLSGLCWGASVVAGLSFLGSARKLTQTRAAPVGLLALALLWVPLTHFPVSNALVLLPTIRADRLWYLPAIGFCLGLGQLISKGLAWPRSRRFVLVNASFFLAFQALQARTHAFDYSSDLTFWRATAHAAPRSAKARLNWGVMLGARGHTEARVALTREAVALAPDWPMGHIYLGDALCRRQRIEEAWPSYARGLELAPNQRGLVALALQCLWDQGGFLQHQNDLDDLAARTPGSWLAYLVRDLELNGIENSGISPAYRPRAYNEKVPGR